MKRYLLIYIISTISRIIFQTIPEDFSDFSNLNWLVKVNSEDEFSQLMRGRDIPISSSVYLYSGNISQTLSLASVYRPAPYLPVRAARWDGVSLLFTYQMLPRLSYLYI